ncbi:MAG: hypothetical protein AAGF77_01335 [Bacteroidota bacterium]
MAGVEHPYHVDFRPAFTVRDFTVMFVDFTVFPFQIGKVMVNHTDVPKFMFGTLQNGDIFNDLISLFCSKVE